ncbi:MAG: response regulator [Planctomycetes bacterium]|nr:response regulator [Planctomycetota bacterium]
MATPVRILVVDDVETNRLLLSGSMEKAGYDVTSVSDGFEAVKCAVELQPDLILLDIMMPGRSGLEVCRILKSREETARIPVIFVTSVTEVDQILQGFAVGGCDYVTKPFKSDEVLARVSVHVRLRRADEELLQINTQMAAMAQQLSEINAELVFASRFDALTKLFNRGAWYEIANAGHEDSRRRNSAYSVIMIDLDHFKTFNDSQGHRAGDNCLRQVAEAVRLACGGADVVGRYGGEEFVVFAMDTHGDSAVNLAERIRKAVWALGILHPESETAERITISAGIATSTGQGAWERVLEQADQALYVAKRGGRNMVYRSQTSPSEVDKGDTTRPAASSGTPTDGAFDHQMSVLVVDDEPTNRTICKGCLQRAGYTIREAADGRAAITSVHEDPPWVILMDVMMPEMDGLECTRRLKADPDTRDIPIIIVSALAKGDDVLAGLEAGADEYLTKPISTAELTLRVGSMARRYRDRADLLRSYEVRGEHVRILMCLVEFCRAVGTSQELDQVLEHTVSTVASLVHARRVSVMLPDAKRESLSIRSSLGLDEEFEATVRVPVGKPIAGQVFASGDPVVVNTNAEGGPDPEAYDSRFFASVPMISAPLGTADAIVGVLNVTERIGGSPFEPHELEYIELIGQVAGTAIHDILTRESREKACDSIVVGLAKLAEHRDNNTGLHLERVLRFCRMLAEDLRENSEFRSEIDDEFLYNLDRAVPLHDIGKVAIPDHILLCPGKLTDQQMAIMRTHAAIGAKTIRSLIERSPDVGFLAMAADIAHYHHEWYDGSGYPEGLKANEIPLSARITAIADVYDALTTKRVYKEAFSHEKSFAIIVERSGTQFDPAIVDVFIKRDKDFVKLSETMVNEPPSPEDGLLAETRGNTH